MSVIDTLKDIRALWTERRYTGKRTPTQAGDLIAKQLTDLIALMREGQHAGDAKAVAETLHATQERIFDTECYHGTYSGGAMNGQPFATCEILARAVVRDFTVTGKEKTP